MLTADLVVARKKDGELKLVAFDAARKKRALAIAEELLLAAEASVGATREELDQALDAVEAEARDARLKAGLAKLVADACDLEEDAPVDPASLRRALFTRAAEARRRGAFDRAALVAEAARENEMEPDALERALFADLPASHVVRGFAKTSPAALVAAYERGQAQAVLLRAAKVTLDVRCATAGAARALFRKLKFLRLCHTVTKAEEGHRIVIDGPFSLFESVTKYGLQLAMLLPALDACDAWSLVADVRWGKTREPLVFRLEGSGAAGVEPSLPDDIADLARAFAVLDTPWHVRPATAILDLPGVGLCVPDLTFERGGRRVHLEVMGYWSRDAVWRRVELVERGLAEPILFAVSARLRVSEEVLDPARGGALYVYKGTMSPRAIAERLDRLLSSEASCSSTSSS